MKYKDGRGENNKMVKLKNIEAVKSFFKKNPNTTIKECCEQIGLSYPTVRRHIDYLEKA